MTSPYLATRMNFFKLPLCGLDDHDQGNDPIDRNRQMLSRKGCAMRCVVLTVCVVAGGRLWAADKPNVYLNDMTPKRQTGRVVDNASALGGQLNPGRERFERGLGMQADSEVVYDVSQHNGRFEAWVGPNRWALDCTVAIRVYTDGQLAFDSGDVTQQPGIPAAQALGSRPGCVCRWRAPRNSAWWCSFSAERSGMPWSIGAMPGWWTPPRRGLSAGSQWNYTPLRRRLPWAGTVGTARAPTSTRN